MRCDLGGREEVLRRSTRMTARKERRWSSRRTRTSRRDVNFDLTVPAVNGNLTHIGTVPSIESIAARIDAEVAGSSLERLGAAAAIAEEMRQLGDSVVDRYVQAARADQRSWSQIGEALGVSKQAAQQRFVAQPLAAAAWPGLSEAASNVATRAVEEARLLRHRYLGTEHLLLALASDE